MASRIGEFFSELKRRKVYHVAVVYVLVGLAVAQGADWAFDLLEFPNAASQFVAILLVLGLPIALVLAWAYEVRPERAPGSEEPATSAPSQEPTGSAPSEEPEVPGKDPSIVVLPFENLSPDAGDDYLADGVTEEITADLSGLHSLRVISRTSAMQYRDTGKDLPTIGKELSVRYVLEGSVRKAGDDLRITCQLIDASNDSHLWAGKFAGTMPEIFDLQERVARSVVETLAIELDFTEERSLAERPIPDVRAYESYLRARQGLLTFGKEGLLRAQKHLEEALEITGENALLLGQLAQVHYQYWNMGIRLEEEDLQEAREYADRALELDPKSPDHHLIRGVLCTVGESAVRALRYLDRGLELDPDHADTLGWYAALAVSLGLEEEAESKLARLKGVDPLHPFATHLPIMVPCFQGRFDAALELAEQTRAAGSPEMLVEMIYAYTLALSGRPGDGASVLRQTFSAEGGYFAREMLALASALEGDREGAEALVDQDLERWAEKDLQYSLFLAEILSLVGERDRALDWLETAADRGNINHPFISSHDVFLEPLRDHPRFQAVLDRMRKGREEFLS